MLETKEKILKSTREKRLIMYQESIITFIKNNKIGTSLAVHWLRLHASTVGGPGLIPGWGAKTLTYHMAVVKIK